MKPSKENFITRKMESKGYRLAEETPSYYRFEKVAYASQSDELYLSLYEEFEESNEFMSVFADTARISNKTTRLIVEYFFNF